VSDLVTLAHRQAAGAERPLEASGDEVEIRADRLRLEQAVVNLVDNALRHGSGTIELDVLRDNGAVEIHVRDRGPGFAPGFEVAAFDRFRRGDDAREGEGSGLGLAIVSAIAHAHGGEAGAGSRPGGGADVWIRLPVA
jgi:signal transduction histidine kinase